MPLCSDILTSPFQTYKTQFEVDAPRISFYINDITCYSTQVASILHKIQKWCDNHHLDIKNILPWCTQIPFATLYEQKQKTIRSKKQYLFDNGRQSITLDRHSGVLHIVKPFRIDTELENGDFKTIQYISLHVTVYNDTYSVDWIHHSQENRWTIQHHTMTLGLLCALGISYYML